MRPSRHGSYRRPEPRPHPVDRWERDAAWSLAFFTVGMVFLFTMPVGEPWALAHFVVALLCFPLGAAYGARALDNRP